MRAPAHVKARRREAKRQQRTLDNSKSSFFKKLPAELRIHIYDLAMPEGTVVNLHGHNSYPNPETGVWNHDEPSDAKEVRSAGLGITHACQQLRNETFKTFYARTTFLIDFSQLPKTQSQGAKKWLASLPPGALDVLTGVMLRGWSWDTHTNRRLVKFSLPSGKYDVLKDKKDCDCLDCLVDTQIYDYNLRQMTKVDVREPKEVKLGRIFGMFQDFAWVDYGY